MKLIQLHLHYSFEEIQILKIFAKFPNDAEKAFDLLKSVYEEYNYLKQILEKFQKDGIWDLADEDDELVKTHSVFKIDLKDLILNYPNPIPDDLSSGIDASSILEKLTCSNLNPFEISFLTALVKNEMISKP